MGIEHECDPQRDLELNERAFRGLKRGVQWQLCPNEKCKRRVELSDGCNHMRCVCRMHFCFVCGEPVRDGEGHWRREGGCPRFGQKGSRRAIYDEEDAWDDNGDVGDEERAREMQRQEDGEEEALRRAFEVQMRMVVEMRRELEEAEATRLQNRDQHGGRVHASRGQPHRRMRRMEPREAQEILDEQRYWDGVRRGHSEHRPQAPNEGDRRKHRGFRAFINDAVDATEHILTGRGPARRR